MGTIADLGGGILRLTGIESRIGPLAKTLKYSVTNHRVELTAHAGEALRGTAKPGLGLVDARWVRPDELSVYTFSSAGRRLIEWIKHDPARLQPQASPDGP
jgi:hypothetical protein